MTTGQALKEYETRHVPSIIDKDAVIRILNILSRDLGNIEVEKLTRKDLLEYRNRRNLAASTVNRELRLLSAAINYCKSNCLIEDFKISMPMSKEKPKTNYLTEEKIRLLIENSPNSITKDFISLLYLSAQRFSACQQLKWSQIRNGLIYFNTDEQGGRMKNRATIGITKDIQAILDRLRAGNDSLYVFPDTRGSGGFCKTLRAWFKDAAKSAGIDITPHGIRHSSASNALGKGASIYEVSSFLGHSSTAITQRVYIHSDPKSTFKTSSMLSLSAGV
jgi:integrase